MRERAAERVRYLTVDEYQDVNPVQERLIDRLAELYELTSAQRGMITEDSPRRR